MKSILKLRTLTLGLLVIVAIGACNKPAGNTGADSNIDYYTCTMHPSVHSKTPGKCPICSMDLVPVFKRSRARTQAPPKAIPQQSLNAPRRWRNHHLLMPREISPASFRCRLSASSKSELPTLRRSEDQFNCRSGQLECLSLIRGKSSSTWLVSTATSKT